MTRRRVQIWSAAVNGQTMVKADLSLFERERDLHYATLVAKAFAEPGAIGHVKLPQLAVARPSMTPVDNHERSHALIAALKRNPRGEHVWRRTGLPVRAVGVPADAGLVARGVHRLVDHLVVPQPNAASGQPSRDRPKNRICHQREDLGILQR